MLNSSQFQKKLIVILEFKALFKCHSRYSFGFRNFRPNFYFQTKKKTKENNNKSITKEGKNQNPN